MVSHAHARRRARIGQTRADQRGGHIARSPGKAAAPSRSSAATLSPTSRAPEEPFRSPNTPIVGENRGVIDDRR